MFLLLGLWLSIFDILRRSFFSEIKESSLVLAPFGLLVVLLVIWIGTLTFYTFFGLVAVMGAMYRVSRRFVALS